MLEEVVHNAKLAEAAASTTADTLSKVIWNAVETNTLVSAKKTEEIKEWKARITTLAARSLETEDEGIRPE
jgi:hypothetical protein